MLKFLFGHSSYNEHSNIMKLTIMSNMSNYLFSCIHLYMFAIITFTVMLFFTLPLLAMNMPSIDNITINKIEEEPGQSVTMTIELSEVTDTIKPKIFIVEASKTRPSRLVIDLPASNWNFDVQSITPLEALGTSIRTGRFNRHTTRIVIDLYNNDIQITNITTEHTSSTAHIQVSYSIVHRQTAYNAYSPKDTTETIVNPPHNRSISPKYATKIPKVNHRATKSSTPRAPVYIRHSHTLSKQDLKVIVIDPGHGGKDPGALYKNIQEKNINLEFAHLLAQVLHKTGKYRVILTRRTDKYLTLKERVTMTRAVNANVFLSIHFDSSTSSSTHGVSVYTLSAVASDRESERLAKDANKQIWLSESSIADEPLDIRHVLVSLVQRSTVNDSVHLAKEVVTHLNNKVQPLLPNPHRQANFHVLRTLTVPAILIELGFITNSRDRKNINNKRWKQSVAHLISDSLSDWFASRHTNHTDYILTSTK